MKPQPWWNRFQIIAYVVAGLTALGTSIVFASRYITLPDKVEANERHDVEQDKILEKLAIIEEQNQQLLDSRQQPIPSRNTPIYEYDAKQNQRWCCDTTTEDCWNRGTWYGCDTP